MRRPRAAALLEQAQGADRLFDAVIVGEFERAFTERQFHEIGALLVMHGLTVWLAEADFVSVQQIRAARVADDGVVRRYLLAGLIRCGPCGRLMDAHWVNGRAGYRCRHGHNSARPASTGRPGNPYVREDKLVFELAQRLKVDGDTCASRASGVVAHLRSRNMVVVHDRTGWRVAARDDV